MNINEFRKQAHELVDWMADYLEQVRRYPPRSTVAPREIFDQIPDAPPEEGEAFERLTADFERIIVPGMTHWQSPHFHAYFPANSSPPSVLAEMLTATMGAQCMSWLTSPAATELEEAMMNWLGQMIGIPESWHGVIQDTASTATLTSLITARERATDFDVKYRGLAGQERFVVYGSTETHSSIDKAVRIAGFGDEHLRKVAVDESYALVPAALEEAITRDRESGLHPLAVVATIGTTGSTAIDPLRAMGKICNRHGLWLHVDAAFAGSACILPEMQWMIDGVELADTFVFNPHKWMLTNFDCSAYFVKDKEALIRTFEMTPEYLKTKEGVTVNNYRDWGIPLGRRFRALKLWFVIRTYGVKGLQEIIKRHIDLAAGFRKQIESSEAFEVLAPSPISLVCFRYHPPEVDDERELNRINERLLDAINQTGEVFMTHTKLDGTYTLRFVAANTYVELSDVEKAWKVITKCAASL